MKTKKFVCASRTLSFCKRVIASRSDPRLLLRSAARAHLFHGWLCKSNMRWLATMFHFHFRRDHVKDGFVIPPSLPSVHCSVHDTYCCRWISSAEACVFSASEALPCCIVLLVRYTFLIQATSVRTHPARVVARLWLSNLLFPFIMCI